MARVLFNLPSFDMPTKWATSFFNRYLLPWSFVNMFLTTRELYRRASRRDLFSNMAIRSDFITGTGHGNADSYAGQNRQILWKVSDYSPAEVEGKLIKLLTCEAGELLGPNLIENGAQAFQGYTEPFAFFIDAKHVLLPWLDPVGSKFLMPPMKGIRTFLEGGSNQEAYQAEYDEHTQKIEAEDDPELKGLMESNRDSLILLGDPDAKLEETRLLLGLLRRH